MKQRIVQPQRVMLKNFLRQATSKPICKWMLEDALKHEQRLFEWQVRRM